MIGGMVTQSLLLTFSVKDFIVQPPSYLYASQMKQVWRNNRVHSRKKLFEQTVLYICIYVNFENLCDNIFFLFFTWKQFSSFMHFVIEFWLFIFWAPPVICCPGQKETGYCDFMGSFCTIICTLAVELCWSPWNVRLYVAHPLHEGRGRYVRARTQKAARRARQRLE